MLAPKRSNPFTAVLSCSLYAAGSISMVLVNKLLLSTYEFDYPNLLLLHQCTTSLSLILVGSLAGWVKPEPLEWRKVRTWVPLNLLFLFMLVSGFYSLKYLSVPMVLVFKNSNNVLVTFGDWMLFQQAVTPLVVLSLVLLIFASALAAAEDLEFSLKGYVWSLFNMLASTCYLLYLRSVMRIKLSKVGMSYYNNMCGIPIVLMMDAVTSQDVVRFYREDCLSAPVWGDYQFVALFISSGFIGLGLNLASYWCLATTSATTYSMVGAVNKVPLAFLGVRMFHSRLTSAGAAYVALSIGAGTLYGLAKIREARVR
jgi:GDP-mannose transporter